MTDPIVELILVACVALIIIAIALNEVLQAIDARECWLRQEYFASREYWARISDIAGVPMREKDEHEDGGP